MFNSPAENFIILIICVVVLILLLCTLIVAIIYNYQKKQLLYLKNIEDLNAKHQSSILASRLEIQEQTFKNISKDIHDNIGKKLTLAKLNLNNLDFLNAQELKNAVTETVDMITESMEDLRDISRSMSSDIIKCDGLIEGIKFEALQLKKLKIYTVKIEVLGEVAFLPSYAELVIFRIVQEALNNIVKHASATEISIRLIYQDDNLTLEIKDNGIGFSEPDFVIKKMGLVNIKKRTRLLQGKCTFFNEGGACITVEIPITKNISLREEDILKTTSVEIKNQEFPFPEAVKKLYQK